MQDTSLGPMVSIIEVFHCTPSSSDSYPVSVLVITQSLVSLVQGEVLELLKGAGRVLQLVVIAGGLRSPPVPRGHHSRAELRYRKAKAFHSKVSRWLLCSTLTVS